ncbi:Myosin-1 [Labeo rohita]|uniref:Myosin-1 n=1 Tax=Labeo rohita TaxID=84645 RepID=A0ABQ8LQH3_LABRO|nr:Myosin-1 [Labeo rohita]
MYHIRPEFILLQLKQGDLPLEGYTIMFQLVAHTTSYPDDTCVFYNASLNASCRAPSSEDGPRADFATFVEWTLARNRSSFPACSMDNLASATPDPEPSQPPRPAESQPEPTDDEELQPAATSVPSLRGATEQLITTEPELHEPSDQVHEPATMAATVEGSVENESAEDSITHCTTTEGELNWILGHLTMNDIPDNSEDVNTGLSVISELSTCSDFPPTLPQSKNHNVSAMPPLLPVSPSTHPQPTICAVGSPQVCQSPATSWLEDPSSIPLAQPQPSVALAPPRTSGSPSPPWSPEPWAPPGPSGSSVSPRIIGSPSPPRALPPPAPPPSVGPMESPAFPPPWLLPPSAPPWGSIMAAVWVSPGSSCSSPFRSPP